jgi:glycosyltransferase involved in cell wall biosynthesis
MGMQDLHIGLAPLADDHFNRSKSYVKTLEYAGLGIPVIASNVGPYRDFVQHGITGFLANNEAEWTRYLRLLGSDENLRQWMGTNAREVAAKNTIQGNAWRWLNTYQSLAKKVAA